MTGVWYWKQGISESKKLRFQCFSHKKKVSFWCFFCWDVFFGKSWRMYFFHVAHIELLKISWRGTLESPGRFCWKYQRSKTCGKPRWTPSVSGWEPGCCFFLVNRWWGAPSKCPTSAFRRNIARLSSGLSDLERISQNSLPRSGFCLSFCCKCWGDYVYIYIYIYLFIYLFFYICIYKYINLFIYIYIYMCSYMHMIFK